MSIEPASVSSPVMRDNDKGLELGAWGGVQGSATGRKDGRQFSSFWDKAVHGAQRLLGFEKQALAETQNEEESAQEESTGSKRQVSENAGQPLRATPGFGNSGFGHLSLSMRRERLNDLIAFSPARPEIDPNPEAQVPVEKSPRAENREGDFQGDPEVDIDASSDAKSEPRRESKLEGKSESGTTTQYEDPSREISDSDEEQAKSADSDSRPNSQRPRVNTEALPVILINTDNKGVTEQLEGVGINSAKQEGTMNALLSAPAPEATEPPQSAVAAGQGTGGEKTLDSSSSKGARLGHSVAELARQSNGDGEAISSFAKSGEFKLASDSQLKASEAPVSQANLRPAGKEELIVDPEKAKLATGETADKAKAAATVARQAKVSPSAPSPVASGTSASQPQAENATLSESNPAESDASALKMAEQRMNKASASKTPQAKGIEGVRVAGVANSQQNVENAASETSPVRRSEVSAFQESIRESQAGDARPVQARPQTNRSRAASPSLPSTAAGVAGAATTKNASGLNAQSQQGNAFGNAGKQESAEQQMMGREAAPKANAPQAKGDGSQAFQVSGSQNSSVSKAEFAVKSQPTSYASKTLEEVKEVYTALSKSIERLASGKGETLSIRINFEQGGTMAIRVSMESGQVSTSMQTDLPGLEGLIKSNWSELANDWNQKGVKLNLPQFTHAEGEGSRNENSTPFAQREGQAQSGSRQDSDANGRQGGGSTRASDASVEAEAAVADSRSGEVISDQELKTYA